jgi:hypothetical protein
MSPAPITMLPEPPLDEHSLPTVGYHMISASLRHGVVGGCVICRSSSVTWWGLAECDMDPVADRYGGLTDWVALHERCIPHVLEQWAIVLHGDPDSDPDSDVDSDSDPPPRPAAESLTPPPDRRVGARRSPTGAYAARRGGH